MGGEPKILDSKRATKKKKTCLPNGPPRGLNTVNKGKQGKKEGNNSPGRCENLWGNRGANTTQKKKKTPCGFFCGFVVSVEKKKLRIYRGQRTKGYELHLLPERDKQIKKGDRKLQTEGQKEIITEG